MRVKNILVTGSLAFDFIMDFPDTFRSHIDPEKIHILNASFVIQTLQKTRGGTAGNIAYSLTLLQNPTTILGVVGNDFTEYEEFLRKNGVNTANIKVSEKFLTSQAFMITDKDGNQISAFYPGAMVENIDLEVSDVKPLPSFAILSPSESNSTKKYAAACKKLGIQFMYDPGQHLTSTPKDILRFCIEESRVLIGNDYEIGVLKKSLGIKEKDLLDLTKILIITLGPKGSLILTEDESIEVLPAKPIQVLDPTGAGDAYRAGFITGYLKGFDLKTCGQMGSVASCYAVEKYGTNNHVFTVEEFKERYRQNFKSDLDL